MDKKDQQKQADQAVPTFPRRRVFNWIWGLVGTLLTFEFLWFGTSLIDGKKKRRKEQKESVRINVGDITSFKPDSVTPVPQGQFYLSCLEDGSFLALSKTCTHLGCALPWDEEAGKFICPCHGSMFSRTGEVLSPPATKNLNSYEVSIENNMVFVDTSRVSRVGQTQIVKSVKG